MQQIADWLEKLGMSEYRKARVARSHSRYAFQTLSPNCDYAPSPLSKRVCCALCLLMKTISLVSVACILAKIPSVCSRRLQKAFERSR